MNFWDSSALVPLIITEPRSEEMLNLHEQWRDITVWLLTPLETLSALARLKRTGHLNEEEFPAACAQLAALRASFILVPDVPTVAARAERIIAVHPLKAADSLQLAAALILCQDRTTGHQFITLDARLGDCARREGFTVLPRGQEWVKGRMLEGR